MSGCMIMCRDCKYYWEVTDNDGACCTTSGSDQTMVKVDTPACMKFVSRWSPNIFVTKVNEDGITMEDE